MGSQELPDGFKIWDKQVSVGSGGICEAEDLCNPLEMERACNMLSATELGMKLGT